MKAISDSDEELSALVYVEMFIYQSNVQNITKLYMNYNYTSNPAEEIIPVRWYMFGVLKTNLKLK